MKTYLLALVFATMGCAGCKGKPPPEPIVDQAADGAGAAAANQAQAATEAAMAELARNFERVHFEVDSSNLTSDSKDALTANAAILQEFPKLSVEIQGHADERGTTDYNLVLGQRRARAVLDFLADSGVAPRRIAVVSFGEERPLEAGSTEVAWAANRRAEFRVIDGAPPGVQGTTP
ncbi:MAG: OmpA family protein [Myxococcales bacterium]|nr:OmpA family protein [Myxococcales bacterium]